MTEQERFADWAILELMGHRRLAGYVEDVEAFGGRAIRIDIFEGDADTPTATQFYGLTAMYALTPTTSEIARAFAAKQGTPRPVARYELEPPMVRPGISQVLGGVELDEEEAYVQADDEADPQPDREALAQVPVDLTCMCGHLESDHEVDQCVYDECDCRDFQADIPF